MENKELYIKKIVNKETERKREFVYVSENVVFNLLKKTLGRDVSNNLSHITIFCCAKTESNSWKFFLC